MKKIVVIGGGFAGSLITRKLEKHFNLTLIDSKNYFEFTPGILRTIVEPEHINKIQISHKDYLKKARIILGYVNEIGQDYVKVNHQNIKFDYLCICSGSRYKAPIKEQNLVISARAAHLKMNYGKLCKANKILIIGGGIVGVELAAEISTHYKNKDITLVHSKNKLMERNKDKTIKYAGKFLTKKGVKIIYNERVVDAKENDKIYHTDKNRKIKTDLAFLCTGIMPNFEFMNKNFNNKLDEKNQIKVNEHLQLDGEKNIFVAGDVNSTNVEKTAQNAEIQARVVIKNIFSLEKNKKLKEYNKKKTPLVISLGKWNGIFESNIFVFTGIIPGIMKSIIELREMLKLKSRRYIATKTFIYLLN